MTPNMIDLLDISPTKGDCYSPRLYDFLDARRGSFVQRFGHLHRGEDGTLWFGYRDDAFFIGNRLNRILNHGKNTPVWAFVDTGPLQLVEDFWNRYLTQGRCAIDIDHSTVYLDDPKRWNIHQNSRSCRWCGFVQVQETYTETRIMTRWVSEAEAANAS